MKMREPKMLYTNFDPSKRAGPVAEQNGSISGDFYVQVADLTLRSCIECRTRCVPVELFNVKTGSYNVKILVFTKSYCCSWMGNNCEHSIHSYFL